MASRQEPSFQALRLASSLSVTRRLFYSDNVSRVPRVLLQDRDLAHHDRAELRGRKNLATCSKAKDCNITLQHCHSNSQVWSSSRQSLSNGLYGDGALRTARSSRTSCRRDIRSFHDYFVTHLPPTSMHPESHMSGTPRHLLPRAHSSPHTHPRSQTSNGNKASTTPNSNDVSPGSPTDPSNTVAAKQSKGRSPALLGKSSHDMTVVRIPLRKATHHFGAACARGTRPYNEDAFQAGTIDIPAFAKKAPASVTRKAEEAAIKSEREDGDPQVFYFGVFDGHGGDECSAWLRENLHRYIEDTAHEFHMESSLLCKNGNDRPKNDNTKDDGQPATSHDSIEDESEIADGTGSEDSAVETKSPYLALVHSWKSIVGGYFRRFRPEYFSQDLGGQGLSLLPSKVLATEGYIDYPTPLNARNDDSTLPSESSLESVVSYSFLKADLDFITRSSENEHEATADIHEKDDAVEEDCLGRHHHHSTIPTPFLGGSTCSLLLISTPTARPFWAPSAPLTLLTSHVGDTRIMLCSAQSGLAVPLTSTHHPGSGANPEEERRLRRYAQAFTTDSFGEERLAGLANTRAFGDRRSKRVGVSAEPELRRVDIVDSSEYSFLALVSDGVTGSVSSKDAHHKQPVDSDHPYESSGHSGVLLTDQEIVDIIKEARTPEQAARDVVGFATTVAAAEHGDADNATCLVIRLGGWERRQEGGGGSYKTKETRARRKKAADEDSRRGRQ